MNANSDALLGKAWWNTASKATRTRWLAAAGSAVPAQAWECFKRSSALPREPEPYFGVVESSAVDMSSNAANFWPKALKEPAFVSWAHRITLKVLNMRDPGNAPAPSMRPFSVKVSSARNGRRPTSSCCRTINTWPARRRPHLEK